MGLRLELGQREVEGPRGPGERGAGGMALGHHGMGQEARPVGEKRGKGAGPRGEGGWVGQIGEGKRKMSFPFMGKDF